MPEPDLFARPLGPDGKPTGPMRRLGSNFEVRVDPGARDQWEQVEKILTRPNPYLPGLRPARFMSEYTFTIQPGDEARVMSLFHGGPTWMWETRLAWVRCDTRPLSRGTAWRDGAYAACQHQLTGPPEPSTQSYRFARRFPSLPPLPRWYIDLMLQQMRDLDRDLFDARAWYTEPSTPAQGTVARDYPPPAEPCQECIAFGQTWQDRLRALLYDAFLAAQQPARPTARTDFMPHYPK